MTEYDFSECEINDPPLCFECHARGREETWSDKRGWYCPVCLGLEEVTE